MERDILMPRLGVNDDTVTLVKWLVRTGNAVHKGQKIANIESTKETSEILADADGIITLLATEDEEVKVNCVIAHIGSSVASNEVVRQEEQVYRITEKARALVELHHIDISSLPHDRLIKEKDVLNLIREPYQITPTMSNKVLIYGGGGFGKMAISILQKKCDYEISGVLDVRFGELKNCLGVPVIGTLDDAERLYQEGHHKIVNAVGFLRRLHVRKEPYEVLKKKGFEFPNIIHDRAIIEPFTSFGEGNLIFAGAIIGPDAKIGNNCIINEGSVIAHDCIISDHCHIASGTVLAGGVIVGENTLIGQNCTIYNDVKIGKNVIIKNGCHIFKNVADNEVVLNQR